jgi:hypothetical protein
MRNLQRAIVLGLLLLCGPGARGEVFKCTDADGTVQFTDHPCGTDSTVIPKRATPPDADDPNEQLRKTQRLLDAMRHERQQAEQHKAEQQAAAEERKRECARARDYLSNVNWASHLYRLDEQGNRIVLSEQERASATGDARARVAKWCK